jgi:hypothetical protein
MSFAPVILIPTRVAPSAIHGLGLFTAAPVPAGTPVWRFVPGFDQAFAPAAVAALPAPARAHLKWFGWVRRDDGHVVLGGDHACFMNHAPAPVTGVPPGAADPGVTLALCNLPAGEELTCDYRAFDADAAWKLGAG